MLFPFGPWHRVFGWLLTLVGLCALTVGGSGYLTGSPVRHGWVVGGLIAVVGGTALIRWAQRARPG
jgi:hypothetical protein